MKVLEDWWRKKVQFFQYTALMRAVNTVMAGSFYGIVVVNVMDDELLELLRANELMGAALTFIYREYPDSKARVAEYLSDYPFELSQ